MRHVEIPLKEAVKGNSELFDQAQEIARTLGRPVVLALNGDHYDIQPLAPTTEQTALEVVLGPLIPPFEACEIACYRATTEHRVAILKHQEVSIPVFPNEDAENTFKRWQEVFIKNQRGENKDEEVIDPEFTTNDDPMTAPELLRELDRYMAGVIEVDALLGLSEGGKALAIFVKRELIGLEKRPERDRLEAENANIPEPDEPAWARFLTNAKILGLLREANGNDNFVLKHSDTGWYVFQRGQFNGVWITAEHPTPRAAVMAAVYALGYKGPERAPEAEPDEPAWARGMSDTYILDRLRQVSGQKITLDQFKDESWAVFVTKSIYSAGPTPLYEEKFPTSRAAALHAVKVMDYPGPGPRETPKTEKPPRDPIDEIVCQLVSIEGVKKVQLEFEKECGSWSAQIPAPFGTRFLFYTAFYPTPLEALRKLKEVVDAAVPF